MIIIKSEADLDGMRASGRVAATVRDALVQAVRPGITTGELSEYAGSLIAESGAESAFKGYRGYPGQICVSVNDAVVHGVPGSRRIEIGDIVSIDVGIKYQGYIGDTATTVMVGVTDQDVIRLVNTAKAALDAAIGAALTGGRLSDISHAIERMAVESGFSVVREFVGHGIGREMHEDPQIPNFGRPGRGPRLKSGMTMAIEPMINMGKPQVDVHADGWTVLTRDGNPSAHCEHTVAVSKNKAEILTL